MAKQKTLPQLDYGDVVEINPGILTRRIGYFVKIENDKIYINSQIEDRMKVDEKLIDQIIKSGREPRDVIPQNSTLAKPESYRLSDLEIKVLRKAEKD